jgi:hypothetical protein
MTVHDGMLERWSASLALAIATCAILATLILPASSGAVEQITALGELTPYALNDKDEIVGAFEGSEGGPEEYPAARWKAGTLTKLPEPEGFAGADAFAINASGRIAGDLVTDGPEPVFYPAYWEGASAAHIIPTGGYAGFAFGVDSAGDVAGIVGTGKEHEPGPVLEGPPSGFFAPASGGGIEQVGRANLGGEFGYTTVVAMNPSGVMLGRNIGPHENNGFYLWSSPSAFGTSIPLVLYDENSVALGGNDSDGGEDLSDHLASDGTVLGRRVVGSENELFIRTPDGTETAVPGFRAANAVNAQHTVVGQIFFKEVVKGKEETIKHAASWSNGVMTDLNSLLPPGSPWTDLIRAYAINDNGDIAGVGLYEGRLEGFLMPGKPVNSLTASIEVTGGGGVPLTGAATAIGSQVVAKVTVAAPASNTAPVSAIAADPSLTISPSPALTYLSGPVPASIDGRTLAPGQSVSYTDTYKIAATGHVDASVEVTGLVEGEPITTKGSKVIALGQPLEVSVAWLQGGQPLVLSQPGQAPQPNTIKLADGEKEEVPQDVTAQVTVKNTSGVTEENISFNGIPALSYHSPGDARQALPIGVTSGPTPSATIEALAPGATAKVTFNVHVTGNGVFDFSPQLLSSDESSLGTNVSQGVGTLTALPTALLWLSLHRVGTGLVQAGTTVEISGTVVNRSLTQTIEVDPLEAKHEGNAGQGELVSDTLPPELDGVQLPFSGKIKPGETVDITGKVATAVEPETLGKVTYEPSGEVLAPNGTPTALTPSQVGMTAGSSTFAIGINSLEPALPAATLETVLDNFSDAAVKGLGEWTLNELSAGYDLLRHPLAAGAGVVKGFAGFAVGSARATADAASLVGAVYILAVAGESMSAAERGQFAEQIVADFKASHLGADYNVVAQAAAGVLGSFETAVRTGDYNKVAALAGGTVATGLTAAGDALLSDIVFQKLTIGMKYAGKAAAKGASGGLANAIVLADAIRDAKATSVLGKGIAGVDAGTNLLLNGAAALTDGFGLTRKQITELRNYCQRSKIIVAVRSRSKQAAELIKKGLAVGKNEIIKIKNVNSFDVEFLGYSKHDINTVVWAQPLSDSEVLAKLSAGKAGAETQKIVLERLKLRQKEWKDPHIREVLENAKLTGLIDWSFDGAGNGAAGASKAQVRRFELKPQPSPVKGAGRTYEQVLVGNKPGHSKNIRLVPVTQDVDMMAILASDGSILSSAERVAAYIHLSDILGIEHGETPTWLKDGEIIFQAKAKQLADVVKGGEPLAVFAPTGTVTGGFFNAALTIFDTATKGGRIFFEGGYNNPYSKVKTQIELALKGMG